MFSGRGTPPTKSCLMVGGLEPVTFRLRSRVIDRWTTTGNSSWNQSAEKCENLIRANVIRLTEIIHFTREQY